VSTPRFENAYSAKIMQDIQDENAALRAKLAPFTDCVLVGADRTARTITLQFNPWAYGFVPDMVIGDKWQAGPKATPTEGGAK
jgi:hypothetical protein